MRVGVSVCVSVCVCMVAVRAPVLMFLFLFFFFFVFPNILYKLPTTISVLFFCFFFRCCPFCYPCHPHVPASSMHIPCTDTLIILQLLPAFFCTSVCLCNTIMYISLSFTHTLISIYLLFFLSRPLHFSILYLFHFFFLITGEVAFDANSQSLSQFIGLLARRLGVRWTVVESCLLNHALPYYFSILMPRTCYMLVKVDD